MVRRLTLALALTLLAAPAVAAGQEPLLPDLAPVELIPGETVDLYQDGPATILDVGFRAGNVGVGPVELAPLPEPLDPNDPAADCDGDGNPANDRPERQTVYLDQNANGFFERDIDTVTESHGDGCSLFHVAHDHWHGASMSVDLIRQSSGEAAGRLDKHTYCLGDVLIFDFTLPGFDDEPGYDTSACSASAPQGISVGWADQYGVGLPGQQIDVTGIPAGRYCVRQSIDSSGSIDELDDANNVAETPIRMDPATLAFEVLEGGCVPDPDPPPVVDTTAPDTTLLSVPPKRLKTRERRAVVRFEFAGDEAGVALACSLDGDAFEPCQAPFEARLRARRGVWTRHDFAVRAVDAADNADLSPAEWAGQVKRRP